MKQLFILLILFSFQGTLNAHLKEHITLSNKEKMFLINHPIITLGTDKSWKPYIIQDNQKQITGYDQDVLQLITKTSGLKFHITAGNWKDMKLKAMNKEIDGLTTGAKHKERESYLNFSIPYISMKKMIITTKDKQQKINSLKDLDNKKIAIHQSNLVDRKTALQFTKSQILEYETIEEVVESVVTGQTDVMFGNGATVYFANELGFSNLALAMSLNNTMDLVFGVRKDWPEAISIINKSLNAIGKQKLLEIKKKWFFIENKNSQSIYLTKEENIYLKKMKKIKMCIDPHWMPFEEILNNKHRGISSDYIKLIQEMIPIPINLIKTKTWTESLEFIKAKRCDILSLAMRTPNREKYLSFTTPYLSVPLVITTKPKVPFISKFENMEGKTFGITKGYAFVELLKKRYPNHIIQEVDTVYDGLQKVSEGKIFGYIGTLATIGYQFQKNFMGELKISGKFDEKWEGGIATSKDDKMLLNILQKAVDTIEEDQHKKIFNKWIAVKYEQNIDYTLLLEIGITVFLILLIVIYWNLRLKQEITKRKDVEKELLQLNDTLEQRIDNATNDMKNQNIFLEESIKNFEYMLNSTIECIIFYDLETHIILDINKAGIEMLGYKSKEGIVNQNIRAFIPNDQLFKVKKSLQSEVSEPYELTLIKEDNSFIYTINKGRNIILNGKKIRMSTIVDLTDIKHKEKILREQSKLAQMGEMISMIAHQWRQPLGAVSSAVFGIQTKIATNKYDLNNKKEQKEFLAFLDKKHNNINEYIQFLSTTVDDFRNFFKPDKSKELVNLTIPITRALQIVETSMKNKNIHISTDFEVDNSLSLYQNEMMQVILTIIKNSEDNFMEKNTINPQINILTKKKKNTYIISICDNGGGIKDEILDKIFEPYFSTKEDKNGTGLGLYMSKIIVEEHNNGKLIASNTPTGACFEIHFLPIKEYE